MEELGLTENTNYAMSNLRVIVDGEEYPVLKTTKQFVVILKDDMVKRVGVKKVEKVVDMQKVIWYIV